MRRVLVVAALAALVLPGGAWAHATLIQSAPDIRERLKASPAFVRLRFDQSVKALPNAIKVYTTKGRLVSLATRTGADKRVITAGLSKLPRGAYTVRWTAVSADGHVIGGVYTFGVRMRAPPATDAFGASGPTTEEHVVRWLYFLALALLAGGLGFRLLILRGPLRPQTEKRFYQLVGLGAVGAIEVGILAFLLRAEDALQLPFGRFLYGDLSPIAGGTRFGQAFIAMELGFALVAALLYLAWLTDRHRALLWPAFLLGLGFASGLSLSGHSSSGQAAELADWVHLCAAVLWVGGLVQLVAVIWPTAPELRRVAFRRFSRLATVCIALLIAAGTYLSIQRLPQFRDLWQSGYGHVLLVKLGLVSVALVWGAVHQFFALPRITHQGVAARVARSMLGESAVAMAVLLAAAVLVDSRPPARPVPQAPAARSGSVVDAGGGPTRLRATGSPRPQPERR